MSHCVCSVSAFCLFRVYVSGRAFSHAVSLRGSGYLRDRLLFVMCTTIIHVRFRIFYYYLSCIFPAFARLLQI